MAEQMMEFPDGSRLRLAVLVASFNRVDVTIRGLASLREALEGTIADVSYFLLDDASPDGTAARVAELFPDVRVIHGNGWLYWNGGMRAAHEAARGSGPFDAYLMFNDDVVVDRAPIAGFLQHFLIANRDGPTIMVGRTANEYGAATYGGLRSTSAYLPLRVEMIPCGAEPTACDTFHGNFVLVPADVLDRLGFDPGYVHQYGDIDLGLSAGRIGVQSLMWPQPIGLCASNAGATMPNGGVFRRLRLGLTGRNAFSQHAHFIFKHSRSPATAMPIVALSFAKRIFTLVRGRAPQPLALRQSAKK